MKDTNIERPKVTKVKVTVKSSVLGGDCSEILFTVDEAADPNNFDCFPIIRLNSNRLYQTKGNREYESSGDVHTVKYKDDHNIFGFLFEIDVEGKGEYREADFEHKLEEGFCK